MKKLLLFLALLATVSVSTAQEFEKKRLLVDYFGSEKNYSKYVDPIRNQVISGIQSKNRLIVIDADSESSLQLEESRRTDIAALNDDVARQGEIKKLGAHYTLSGSVDNVSTERINPDDGKAYYKAQIILTLKIIDISNGSIFYSKSITITGGGSYSGTTSDKAIASAIDATSGKMRSIIDACFPLKGTIVEMKESKRGKMQSCYVDLGTIHGVSSGQNIKVLVVKSIAGRKSTVEIGTLRIEEVVANDLSDCKVTKGGDEIFEAFTNGDELIIQTTQTSTTFFGL